MYPRYSQNQQRNARRAMTLIELMIVVVIIGVLSVVAVTGYRKYTYAARNSEAVQFLGAVRAAQATYFQAFGQYCGTAAGDDWPAQMPGLNKVNWGDPNNSWGDLGVNSPGLVWFQYKLFANRTGAGAPGESFRQAPTTSWFVARAHGDFNGKGLKSTYEITSDTSQVYIENENQ